MTAIITGVTGQDGIYLSSLLLKKGYRVIGLVRSANTIPHEKFNYLGISPTNLLEFVLCDLMDIMQIVRTIQKYQPAEFYNLAAQSSVGTSFSQPFGTFQFNTLSVLNLLEAIRFTELPVKYYQASSSEMYGKVDNLPITESTPFHPLSPYGISKAASHWLTVNYRESYGLFSCCGILFNHESYFRTKDFFIKKVIKTSLDISKGIIGSLMVGNIDIRRDFGFAPNYVEAMWLMLQQEKAEDFLICSGESIALRDIIEYIFEKLSLPLNKIVFDKALFRPTEILDIKGDNQKAKEKLGWNYSWSFFQVLDMLIDEEIKNYEIN